MEPKIYIDIVFPVTWGMDAFLLWMAGRILGLRRKRWRFAFGGLFAAVCDCAWLFFLQRSGGALFSLLLLAGGVFIAYTPKNGKIFLRLIGTTLLSSFLLGGGAQLLFTFTQAQRLFGQGLIVEQIYPWWLLPWAVLLAYVLLKLGAGWMETHICRRREFCTAAVFRQGRCAEVRVLIDTGAVQFAAVHNHPSGNSRPSNEDKRLTEQLKKAAGLFNITMIDHVIITNGGYYSFGDEGLI